MNFFELDHVSKSFGGLLAVNGISFAMEKGETLGLIGPNGAGKTTVFNLINGYYPPTSGTIRFKGKAIEGFKPYVVCRLGIGRTFQVVKPLSRMTVLDNVMVSAFSRTNSKSEARTIAESAIHFTEMDAWIAAPAKSLPLGMRKRLELARAIATKPELLLLDENFAGLNPTEVEKTITIVKKIAAEGISILIIEHNMRVIMSISSRIVAINYGTKIAEGLPADVARHPEVIAAYLGDEHAEG